MEEMARPPPPGGLQGNMRSKLIREAQSLGDENVAQTAGFGNPYLFIGLIVVGLGVASYYELGLDKVPALGGKLPASGPGSEEEMINRMLETQQTMYGGR